MSPDVYMDSSLADIPSSVVSKKYHQNSGDYSEEDEEKNTQFDSDDMKSSVNKTETIQAQKFIKLPFFPNTGKVIIKNALKAHPKTPQPHSTIKPLNLNKEDTEMD
jgi:hypothetical protein